MKVNVTNLEENRITLFCGDPDVNTSVIAIDLAMSIILGQKDWHGYKIGKKRKAVFFMNLVDCVIGVKEWCVAHKIGIPRDDIFIQNVFSLGDQESYIASIKDKVPDVGLIIVNLGMFHDSEAEVMDFCNLLITTFDCNIIYFDDMEASEIPTDCLTYLPLIFSVTKDDKQIHNVSLYEDGHSIFKYKRGWELLPFENNPTSLWGYNFIEEIKEENNG